MERIARDLLGSPGPLSPGTMYPLHLRVLVCRTVLRKIANFYIKICYDLTTRTVLCFLHGSDAELYNHL